MWNVNGGGRLVGDTGRWRERVHGVPFIELEKVDREGVLSFESPRDM